MRFQPCRAALPAAYNRRDHGHPLDCQRPDTPLKFGTVFIITLAHINIRTEKYEETIVFYETLLGFRRTVSPINPDVSKNTWLLDSENRPCIHVNALSPGEGRRSANSYLDHVAFNCADKDGLKARLREMGVSFKENPTRIPEVTQINLRDPNGIRVELTFGHDAISKAILSMNPSG